MLPDLISRVAVVAAGQAAERWVKKKDEKGGRRLENDPQLTGASAVWPFETGWAMKANWLPKRALIVHAEIYPSVTEPKPDTTKDRGPG